MLATTGYWCAEHAKFEHLLKLLETQLAVLRARERPNYDLIVGVVNYFRHFARQHHGQREMSAFACIVEKDAGMLATTSRLLEEHRVIAAKADELCTLASGNVVGNVPHRAGVEAALGTYLSKIRDHIAAEEKDIVPRAAELLTAMEWATVAQTAPHGPDPFRTYSPARHNPTFGAEGETRYRELIQKYSTRRSTQAGRIAVANREIREVETTERREPGYAKERTGLPAVLRRKKLLAPRNAAAWRLLLRQTMILLALLAAYLQYYLLDVHLQIARLRSIAVYLFS